uniref:CABIT domain-containing protein n=1 Tax=Terrapene triunguis TaxID=2587831 RepID=A0A674J210_9SAUR
MASNLTKFIHSLDPRTLPRVLQIQSGIYFQGSIYEMFGNECCLPTGELIKITGFKINKIIASICESNEDSQCSARIELPLNFPGTVFHEYMLLKFYKPHYHLYRFYCFI